MKKSYPDVQQSDYADEAILKLQERDVSSATWMYGNEFPTDVEEGMIFHNFSTHKVYNYISDAWVEMFDYSEGYLTENVMKAKYQPLNETLTSMSPLTATGAGLIGTSAFYPVGAFGRNALLSVSSAGALRTALGLGKLALLSTATPDTIQEGTITEDKLASDFVLQPEFTTGDVVMSVRQTARAGWIKLGSSGLDTIGVSGATYSGTTYKKLYDVLWKRADCVILTAGDELTSKGESSDSDWADNKKIRLKNSSYNPNLGAVYFDLLGSDGIQREYRNDIQLSYNRYYPEAYIRSAVKQDNKYAYYRNTDDNYSNATAAYTIQFKSSLTSGKLDTSVPLAPPLISSFFTDKKENMISFAASSASLIGRMDYTTSPTHVSYSFTGTSWYVTSDSENYAAGGIAQTRANMIVYSPIVYLKGYYYRMAYWYQTPAVGFSLWKSDKLEGPYESVAAGVNSAYMYLETGGGMSLRYGASINLSAGKNYLYQVNTDGIYRSEDGTHFERFIEQDFGQPCCVSASHLGDGVMTFCVWPILNAFVYPYSGTIVYRVLMFENGTYYVFNEPMATDYLIGKTFTGFVKDGYAVIFNEAENKVIIYNSETGEELESFTVESYDTYNQIASVYGNITTLPLNLDGYGMFNQFIKL